MTDGDEYAPKPGKVRQALAILWRESLRVLAACGVLGGVLAAIVWVADLKASEYVETKIEAHDFATNTQLQAATATLTAVDIETRAALNKHLQDAENAKDDRDAQIQAVVDTLAEVTKGFAGLSATVQGLTNAQSTTQSDVREIRNYILRERTEVEPRTLYPGGMIGGQ